ncbi:MAG: ABC transporter permease [Sporichthyaceae bacterium]
MTALDDRPAAPPAPVRLPGRRRRERLPLILLLPALLAAVVALLPLIYLAVRSTERGAGEMADVLFTDRTLELTLRSLGLAVAVTAGSLVIGIGLAYLVTRTSLPGRRFWAVVAALPLAMPTYVAAFAWISLFPTFGGFSGSLLVLTLCCYPYVFLPVAAVLEFTDPSQDEVARSLGQGPWRTFVSVTLRQVRPAAAAGGLLVMLYVLSDFGSVSILRYDVFTRVIFTSYRGSFDPTPAAILALLLVAITVVIVAAEGRLRGRAGYARIGGGSARPHPPLHLGRATVPALAAAIGIAVLALGVPGYALIYWSARGSSAGIDWSELTTAAGHTLLLSGLGAMLIIVLALPVGILAARHRGRVPRWIEQATYAGHALPGLVVALAVIFLTVRYANGIYQRTPGLLLAYAVLFLPAAVGAVRASVAQSPPVLEDMARALGRSPLGVLRSVTLPLAAPGVAAGAALVFLTCMKELPATILLRPTGVDTLATELWGQTQVNAYAAAAPYAAALVLLAAIPTFILGQRMRALGAASGRAPGTMADDE